MYTVTNINDLSIIEIDDFLSEEDANEILEQRKPFFEKAISHYPSYYRNNDRIVEDNVSLSTMLFNLLKSLDIVAKETKKNIIGVNERIRFCRYQKNQLFSKHQDGVYYPNAEQESKYTFLLYLNGKESFEAGETEFYHSNSDERPIKIITPKKGKLVIFDHLIWHKGAKVIQGNKYILRSDIIVERNSQTTHHDGYIWNLLKLNEEQFLSCGRDRKIKHWNTKLELQNTIEIHSKSVIKMIAFCKDEYLSCSRDFTIKKWNLSGETLSSIRLNEMILNMVCLQNKHIIAVGTSGKIYVLNAVLDVVKMIGAHTTWIWGIAVLDMDTTVSCCEDGRIQLTDISSGKTACIYKHDQPLFCINAEKNKTLLIGSRDGTLIQLCTRTKKIMKNKIHNDIIRSIIHHQQSILSCGEDNKVILMDKRSQETKEILALENFLQDIIVMKDRVFVAGYDGVIHSIKM